MQLQTTKRLNYLFLSHFKVIAHKHLLMSFQTDLTFFRLWNIQRDILKKMFFVHTLNVNGVQCCLKEKKSYMLGYIFILGALPLENVRNNLIDLH